MPRVRVPSVRSIPFLLISALTLALPFSARSDSASPGSSREPLRLMSQTGEGQRRVETVSGRSIRYRLTTPEGVTEELRFDENEETDVLVQLSEAPLATAVAALRPSGTSSRCKREPGSNLDANPRPAQDSGRPTRTRSSCALEHASSHELAARRDGATCDHQT